MATTRAKTHDSAKGAQAQKQEEQAGTAIDAPKNTAVGFPIDYAADAGMGLEGADKSSFAIPFLSVLQGLSPQIETVEGAKPGLFINTVTNELSKEILVIPCAFQRRFLRWAPRSTGGGYKGEYNPVDVETSNVPGMKQVNGMYLMDIPEGVQTFFDSKGLPLYDHLSDTRNHFVLYKTATGTWKPALVSLSSTQIKKSKRWMALIQGIELDVGGGRIINPPSFSHVYRLTTEKEGNAKGEWWGVSIALEERVEDAEVYSKAKEFNLHVSTGKVEVAPPQPEAAAGNGFDEGNNDKF